MATKHGFVDRTAELNFILRKVEGRARDELLGITDLHYQSKAEAQAWYERLREEASECTDLAQYIIIQIYRRLVGG